MKKVTRDDKVQGVALYLEFRKLYSTYQVIITPDGFDDKGKIVDAVMFSRTISSGVTKRKWRTRHIGSTNTLQSHLEGLTESVNQDELTSALSSRFSRIGSYLNQAGNYGYTLVKETPIYVEVSQSDLASVRVGVMPAKLWTRIKSVRNVLDFPDTLVNEK